MRNRKIPQDSSYEAITTNKRGSYNVMQEHNYFQDIKKKKIRWPDGKKKLNHTKIITTDVECHSIPDDQVPDWCKVTSSSDEEDIKDMPLSEILKLEHEKYSLPYEYNNKKCANDLLLINEDQMYNDLNNTNNHDLSNISNDSNNIVSENCVINDRKQSITDDATIVKNQNISNSTEFQTKPFSQSCTLIVKKNGTHSELLSNASINIESKKNSPYNNNLQNCLLNSSSDSRNSLLVKKTHPLNTHIDLTKTITSDAPAENVKPPPPLQWIHLIYLAIKNSVTENVTCYDIERMVRYWFPYFCRRSYESYIRMLLNHLNHYCQKYFHCNSFPDMIDQEDTWTTNSILINTLEESLMNIVENNEDEIKSTMAHPDQLSMIVNGYGVLYLGCSQNSIKN